MVRTRSIKSKEFSKPKNPTNPAIETLVKYGISTASNNPYVTIERKQDSKTPLKNSFFVHFPLCIQLRNPATKPTITIGAISTYLAAISVKMVDNSTPFWATRGSNTIFFCLRTGYL